MIERVVKRSSGQNVEKPLKVLCLCEPYTYISLKIHYDKFHKEIMIVSRVKTVPESKEEQCYYLTVHFWTQKLYSLINVLGTPVIGVYVEWENVVIELRGSFECSQFDVCATVPFNMTFGILSIMRETKSDAHLKSTLDYNDKTSTYYK